MHTIITFYREGDCSYHVGTVAGRLTKKQRRAIAERLALQPDDAVGFVECVPLAPDDISETTLAEWCANQHTRCGRDLIS